MGTEHPHVTLMRRMWEAGARGDADALTEAYAPDVVFRGHGTPGGPLVGEFKGIAEILDYMARAGEIVDDSTSELLEIYASDTGAVVRYRTVATRGGKHLDMQYLYTATIEQERVIRVDLVPFDQRRNDEFWRSQ